MSTGGIFKLITNSGIQDKLLMATDYLTYRMKLIAKRNLSDLHKDARGDKQPLLNLDESWIPDINAISKSHAIFINGAFKPFVASGFEYNRSEARGDSSFGSDVTFTMPQFGDFINDAVVHIRISALEASDNRDRVRYVSMLGHKLLKNVKFKINSSVLDEYNSNDYNAFFEFKVPPEKKIGWLRGVGQEIPNKATLSSDPTYDMFQEYKWFGDGNQTFKQKHEPIDLWVPLLFWFKDIRNALPSIVIPYGQTDIIVTLASVDEIVGFADYGGGGAYKSPTINKMELYINNIFMNPDIVKIFMAKFGFSLIRIHGHHNSILTTPNGDEHLNNLKWPTETLYVCFQPLSNATLSQYWHKCAQLTLNQIKVPVVARNNNIITNGTLTNIGTNTAQLVYVGGPTISSTNDDYNGYDFVITGGTGFNSNVVTNRYVITDYNGTTQTVTLNRPWTGSIPNTTTTFELFTPQVAINVAQYYKETPSINKIQVTAYGIVIYKDTEESFYNSYLPYRFGNNMNTSEDRGWYMINFNYFPGEHQPSGHINLSKAREFYISYTSSFISRTNRTNMIVLSDAINFLLVRDGTAVLRYST